MKRRERNRKSAQKCRERKLHRTQELQAQVEGLHMEVNRLLRDKEGLREYARRCTDLLRQHGVSVPYMNCLLESNETYLPSSIIAGAAAAVPHSSANDPTFCDDVTFYNKPDTSGNFNELNPAGGAAAAAPAWTGRAFSPLTASQLPPMSQLVPTPPTSAGSAGAPAAVVVKSEPQVVSSAYWKNEGGEAIDSFLSEVQHDADREAEWKTENDTDSSPGCGAPRLNTPNTNDGDKTSNLSSSL